MIQLRSILTVFLISIITVCGAQNKDELLEKEAVLALEDAVAVGTVGPSQIELNNFGEIALPNGYIFLPKVESERFLKSIGNLNTEKTVGIIIGADDEHFGEYCIWISYYNNGFIKDDEANSWDKNKLLKDIIRNTEKENIERQRLGFPVPNVDGWIEAPSYDFKTHRAFWSLSVNEDGQAMVNSKALILGRTGYYVALLLTSKTDFAKNAVFFRDILEKINFKAGSTYADYDVNTDTASSYTLAGLVTGIVAKEIGLFALIAAIVVKFWKIVVIGGAISLWAGIKKFINLIKNRFNHKVSEIKQ